MKFLALLLGLAVVSAAAQEAPKLLPFQARLTDAQGAPTTNGVRLVQFRIYPQPVGGTPVWAGEIHRTSINGGLVNVILGTKTPLAGVDFNQQLYLEMTVDVNGDNQITAEDPPLLPRQIVLPTVFAKEAAAARNSTLLNGADWTSILATGTDPRDAASYINAAKLQPGSLTGAQLAAGSISTTNIAAAAVVDTNLAPAAVGLAALKQEIIDQLVPPGTVVAWAGPAGNVPRGWLICDGGTYFRGTYPRLVDAIGTTWGAGGLNGDTFQVPDMRGEFLRGASQGTGRDPDAGSRVNAYIGGNTGDQVGSYQYDQLRSHAHPVTINNGNGGLLAVNVIGGPGPGWNDEGQDYSPTGYGSVTVQPAGGAETRPINVSVYYIIKY